MPKTKKHFFEFQMTFFNTFHCLLSNTTFFWLCYRQMSCEDILASITSTESWNSLVYIPLDFCIVNVRLCKYLTNESVSSQKSTSLLIKSGYVVINKKKEKCNHKLMYMNVLVKCQKSRSLNKTPHCISVYAGPVNLGVQKPWRQILKMGLFLMYISQKTWLTFILPFASLESLKATSPYHHIAIR